MSKKKLIKDFSYPKPADPNIQSKIYKKCKLLYLRSLHDGKEKKIFLLSFNPVAYN
jgi:hypothetical protein